MSEQIEYRGYTIQIKQDNDPGESPRDWDNLGTMVCWHRRYNLGDKHDFCSNGEFIPNDQYLEDTPEDFQLFAKHVPMICLPVYMYEHGGITISTGREYPYNDRWDAGQVGYIYATHEKIRKEYGWKHVTQARADKIREYLCNEVKTYDQYLQGDIYGYLILDKDEEDIESCWGFFGEDYCLEEAKRVVDFLVERTNQELWEAWSKLCTVPEYV
jgi:hypothetical protein